MYDSKDKLATMQHVVAVAYDLIAEGLESGQLFYRLNKQLPPGVKRAEIDDIETQLQLRWKAGENSPVQRMLYYLKRDRWNLLVRLHELALGAISELELSTPADYRALVGLVDRIETLHKGLQSLDLDNRDAIVGLVTLLDAPELMIEVDHLWPTGGDNA